MKSIFTAITLSTLALFVAPLRRMRAAHDMGVAGLPQMDAATRAAMIAEAERIAAPFRQHIDRQLAALQLPEDEELGGSFPEVEALLARAGLLAS
jgi:hypothetical protein